ncbi:MAG: class I SAM-dependent methyltransferase [Planctomycetota bacterium]
MAHKEQMDFVASVQVKFPQLFRGNAISVLEIGSRNINGSVRDFFRAGTYVGLDLSAGPGVDVVCHAADYECQPGSFDVVISCEALEHDVRWRDTIAAACRALRPDGGLIITCAGPARGEHGTHRHTPLDSPETNGYYGNLSPGQLVQSLRCDFKMLGVFLERGDNDVYLFMVKK